MVMRNYGDLLGELAHKAIFEARVVDYVQLCMCECVCLIHNYLFMDPHKKGKREVVDPTNPNRQESEWDKREAHRGIRMENVFDPIKGNVYASANCEREGKQVAQNGADK